ncbi:MAG: hypothetical protein AB7V13_02205 [Pseudorhodoplanes sp.]
MKRKMTALAVAFTLAASAWPATAQQPSGVDTLTEKEVPGSVTARMRCKSPSGPMTRRAFSGGFVFTQSCTDSGEPLVRVVFATDREGAGARILQFHRPEGRRMSVLASVTFAPAENEIAGTTGRLTRLICRAEGRWRMEGKQPAPGLVYWRQTRDCEGKTGWRTVIGRAR